MGDNARFSSTARIGMRRRLREQRDRDRKLMIRHRWYASAVATMLSGALIFTGVSPAMAEVVPTPTPTETAEQTPAPEESSPAPEESAPAPEESAPAPEEPAPAPDESVAAPEEVVPDDAQVQQRSLEESGEQAPGNELISPMSVPAPGAGQAVITVKVGSDRTGITGVTNLQGVTLLLNTGTDSGPSGTRPDGITGTNPGWALCVSDSAGDCSFVVPNTSAASGATGVNRDARYWVVQPANGVPNGYFTNLTLRTGGQAGAGDATPYRFRTGTQLRAGTTYSSQNSNDFMLSSGNTATASGGIWQQSRSNVPLIPTCGLDVALILDISGSVGTALPNLKQAANTFVDSLVGTPSRMSLFSFSWVSPGSGASTNYPNLVSVSTAGQATTFKNRYAGWTSEGGTNWDRGLAIPAASNTGINKFDVAVVITDGNPTTYNDPRQGSGSLNRFRETETGIFSANAIKAASSRVIAFGVGAGATGATNALNLRAISGPVAFNGSNGQVADYYQTNDYATVGAALRNLALGNCAGSLTVTKQIVPNSAPAGSIQGATPAGAGWQFTSQIATPGVTTPQSVRTTTANGTGTVTYPLTFPGGTTQASVTVTEAQQPGFTLVPVGGQNAVCTNLNTNTNVPLTGNPTLGFTVNVPSTAAVNCVVYNRAPSPEADVTVTKKWVINKKTFENGAQPDDFDADLFLTGPGAAGATQQGWGVTRGGYAVGNTATITEQNVVTIDGDLCRTDAVVTNVNGTPVNVPLSAQGYPLPLPGAHNTAEITNTVTCESRLTLIKSVPTGGASPSSWQLHAVYTADPANPNSPPLEAFAGATGTTAVTDVSVTPDARYQLFETGGSPLYAQTDQRSNLESNALSTGSATCIRVDANGAPWPQSAYSDGINGGVEVPLGYRVACTLVNQPAELTLLKHVVNDNGGNASAGAWTLTATPATLTGLTPTGVTGSETAAAANTFPVRPRWVYTLTESSVAGYQFAKLQHFVGNAWVDVVENPTPGQYPRKNAQGNWEITVDALDDPIYRFVNDDVAPKLTLVKLVTNDHGGTRAATEWTLTATSSTGPNLSGATGSTGPTGVTARDVRANVAYTLDENVLAGYDWTTLSCTGNPNTTKAAPTVSLKPGDNVTCTFTNNDQPASLTLIKKVDASNGGNAVAADWNQKLTAKRGSDATLLFNHNETKTNLPAGTYTLNELQTVAGYEWSELVCSTGGSSLSNKTVTIANGGAATCTFTNVAKKPTLTLLKIVDNKNGVGSATPDQWTLSASAEGQTTVTGNGTASGAVVVGVGYDLAEAGGPSGYDPGDWSCYVTGSSPRVTFPVTEDVVTPALNTNVTCEITNTATPATWNVVKDVVDGSPVQNADGTWTIEYDIVVTNESASSTLFYDLSDTLQFGGGITPDLGASTWTGPNGSGGDFDSITEVLATNVSLSAATKTHTYTVTIVANIANGTQDTDTWKCTTTTSPNRGFLNAATVEVGGKTETVTDCAEPAFPTITKVGKNPPTQNPDASTNVEYTLTVANPSATTAIQAELTDALPAVPAGWTLTGGTWTVTAIAGAPLGAGPFTPGQNVTFFSGEMAPATSYAYTITGVLTPGAEATPIGDCAAQGGLKNKASVASGDVVEDAEGCVTIVTPKLSVVKSNAGVVTQLSLTQWEILYDVTVVNSSQTATTYTLTDTPQPGGGWVTDASSGWVPTADQPPVPAPNTPIAAGASHTFKYRMVVNRDALVQSPSLTCDLTNGGGFFNRANLTFPGGTATDTGCATPGSPTVVKTGKAAVANADGTWAISYEVAVSNTSGKTLYYSLTDTPPAAPTGTTITGWAVTGPGASATWPTPNVIAQQSLANGQTHTFTITATVALGAGTTPVVGACGEGTGTGVAIINTATVTNGIKPTSDDGCTSVNPVPVEIDKTVATIAQGSDGQWTIDYTVKVTNPNPTPAIYTLTDAPQFATSFTIQSQGWVGSPDTTDVPLEPNGSDSYTYRVVATSNVDPVPAAGLRCDGPATAFFNTATVTWPGGTASDSDCAAPGKPTVTKTALDSTFDAATGRWGISYDVSVTNTSGLTLSYTLTDEPEALPAGVTAAAWSAAGPVITPADTGTGTRNAAWNGDTVTQLATGVIPNGATHTYRVSTTVTVAASVSDDDLSCVTEGGGIWNTATVTNGIGGNASESCVEIDRGDVDIKKTVTTTKMLVGGSWEIVYDIVVTNLSSELPGIYDLADELAFGGDITVTDAEWSGDGRTGSFDAASWSATLGDDIVIAPRGAGAVGTHTYTVTVHATLDAGAWDGDTLTCTEEGEPSAGGFLNTALLTVNGEEKPADACSEPSVPTIEKLASSALQDPDDASQWFVTYVVRVTGGATDVFYDLSDTPAFAPGIDIISGTAQRAPASAVPITSGVAFVEDVPLAAGAVHEYQVIWLVDITDLYSEQDKECTGEPGSGFFNSATVTVGEYTDDADVCIPVTDRAYPVPTKTVTSTTQDAETGDWIIEYEIEVTLAADGPNAEYDLTDALDFGGDIEVQSARWSGQGTTDEAFDEAGGNWTAELADGRLIRAGQTHTYTVTVTATVTAAAIDAGTETCKEGEGGPYDGFLNTALLTSGGVETPVDACSEPVLPIVEKVAAGYTDNGDGTQTISYLITVTYPDAAASADPIVGVMYDLTDAPELPAGVELEGDWTVVAGENTPTPDNPSWNGDGTWSIISGAEFTPVGVEAGETEHNYTVTATVSVTSVEEHTLPACGEGPGIPVWNTVELTSGEYVDDADACQVVHFDDVGIEKTSRLPEGQTSVTIGDEFDYVLTVTNNGTRPAMNVRVTDDDLNERLEILGLAVAPAEISWGPEPGYTTDPNEVDLTIDSLAVDGSAEIILTVTLLPEEIEGGIPALGPDGEAPTPPTPLDMLENIACVETDADPIVGLRGAPNCDDEEIPVRDITAVVWTRCVADAPLLGWSLAKSGTLVNEPISFLWQPNNASYTPATTPQNVSIEEPGGSATWTDEISWPGSAFTPSGISVDYPGWRPIEASDMAGPSEYYLPGTTTVMTPEQQAEFVINGLILDPTELDYAWRLNTDVTFTVNPTLEFSLAYPAAVEGCGVARHTEVQIEKTASVEKTDPGKTFTYDLAVRNVSTDSAAEGVVVTDVIPADLRITDVTWVGEGSAATFPNWETCDVTGQAAGGYGGTLRCVLFGPLQPVGANAAPSSAPTITLTAFVKPTSKANIITNVAVVDYHTFGDPEDSGRDSDDAIVLLSALPATGINPMAPLLALGFLALLVGVLGVVVTRRRRGEERAEV